MQINLIHLLIILANMYLASNKGQREQLLIALAPPSGFRASFTQAKAPVNFKVVQLNTFYWQNRDFLLLILEPNQTYLLHAIRTTQGLNQFSAHT